MKRKKTFLWLAILAYLIAGLETLYFCFGGADVRERLFLLATVWLLLFFAGKTQCKSTNANRERIMKITFLAAFSLYVIFLFSLTLFDPEFGRTGTVSFLFSDRTAMEEYLRDSVNLTPFETVLRYVNGYRKGTVTGTVAATNLLGNFFALMPMGLFLPVLSRRCRHFFPFLLATAGTVALIEGLQLLFMTGACDVDDLILNLSGAVIVYLFTAIPPIRKIILRFAEADRER